MKYIYTALFEPKDDGAGFSACIPDLHGCVSSGKDLADAIEQISDAANVWLVAAEDEGLPIPAPTPQAELSHSASAIFSLIQLDTLAYRALTDTKAVRKNVSLPAWMANMADKRGINCSQVLQEGLMKRFEA